LPSTFTKKIHSAKRHKKNNWKNYKEKISKGAMHLLERSKVAIIIPAYNESNTIGMVVKKLSKLGKVIVVDDASNDKTSSIAKRNGAFVIRNKFNRGYDNSINIGFKKIKKRQI